MVGYFASGGGLYFRVAECMFSQSIHDKVQKRTALERVGYGGRTNSDSFAFVQKCERANHSVDNGIGVPVSSTR